MVQRSDIERLTNTIAARFSPRQIVLFGSHAHGTPDSDSDVDLLVVMPSTQMNGRRTAAEIRQSVCVDFPVDVVVRTPEDIKWRMVEGDSFLHEVFRTGDVMYEAADA